jgi:V/A-type H+-transporting ATPase subunit I
MSVEKMKIMGVIGKKNLLSKVLRLVLLNGSVHTINALVRVNSSDFFLPPTEKNIKVLEESFGRTTFLKTLFFKERFYQR